MTKKREKYLYIAKDGDNYTISLTPELQDDIGTVGYVDFDVTEGAVDVDDPIATLEASKTVFEIASPLKGTLTAVNPDLEDNPELLNSDKEEENWLYQMTDVDEEAFQSFKDAE